VLGVLRDDHELIFGYLDAASPDELVSACITVCRLGTRDPLLARRLARSMLRHRPSLWRTAAASGIAHGGPFLRVLGELAAGEDAAVPCAGLAAAYPAVFLPHLAAVLTRRARDLARAGRAAEAIGAFEEVLDDFLPGAQAEVLAARALWLLDGGDGQGAATDLKRAAACADSEPRPAWRGRSRRSVRAVAQQAIAAQGLAGAGPAGSARAWSGRAAAELPSWATNPLPVSVISVLGRWLAAASWQDCEAIVREHRADLVSMVGWQALATACALHPEDGALGQFCGLLDLIEANEADADAVLADLRHADLLGQWLATPTWQASLEFLQRRPGFLRDPRTMAVLEANQGHPMVDRHLDIVRIAERQHAPSEERHHAPSEEGDHCG
jgi:hypothetical protein